MFGIVTIMLVAAAGSSAAIPPSLIADCGGLLATMGQSDPVAPGLGAVTTELARRVIAGAGGVKAAIDVLVRERAVPAAQAQTLFSESSLARFSNLFLIYFVAELRARGFDDDQIADYVLFAARAYSVDQRAGLAIGVTARMMLTLNDEPSTGRPDGLTQFLNAARAFDLTEEDYAEFLELWRLVRVGSATTTVHFVMATIERISAEIARERDDRVAARDLAPTFPARWLGLMTGRGPERPPTRGQIERALVARIEIPEFVRAPVWAHADPPPSRFARYVRANEGVRLSDVDLAPPFARAFVLARVIPHLGAADLGRVADRIEWPGLAGDLRASVLADAEVFARADSLRAQLREAVARDRNAERLRPADPVVTRYFFERFDAALEEVARKYRNASTNARVQALVTGVFDKTRAKFPRLGAPEVIVIARRVIDAVAATDLLHATIAAARAAMLITREFDLGPAERRSIVRQLKGYEFTSHKIYKSITRWECARAVLDEGDWGRAGEAPPPAPRAYARLLDRVRRAFEPGDVAMDDEALLGVLLAVPRPTSRSAAEGSAPEDPALGPPPGPPAPSRWTFARDLFTWTGGDHCGTEF